MQRRTEAGGVLRAILVVAVLAALSLAMPRPGEAGPRTAGAVADWATTTGTDGRIYLADAQGRALQFHGFNIKTATPAETASEDLLALAASHGLDHLRLGWFWQDLEPSQDAYDDDFVAELVTVLDRAEALDLKVILDMHQDVFGESFNSRGMPSWVTRTDGLPYEPQESWLLDYLQPAVQQAWEHLYEDEDIRQWQIEAWTYVVERVKDHPALLGYDLLNEPFGKIREGEDLLSAAERVERTQLTPMYQRLTDAISAIDPDHWVFIEPPNLASLGVATSLGEVTGPKVAVYPHMYDADIETATYAPDGTIEFNPEFFDRWADAITTYTDRFDVPMLIGEWGIAEPELAGMDEFVARSLQTMDEVSSGWSQFAMCRGSGYCPFDEDGQPRPGIGQIFQPYARAIAGAPTSTSWDRDAKELLVRFEGNGVDGPTEIYVGADRTYPEGWQVETSEPDGDWSWSYDEATGVVSVTTSAEPTAQAICVKPAGAEPGCAAVDAPEPPVATTAPPGSAAPPGAATPARPVSGQATFTG